MTYVVSDIHGEYDKFVEILDKIDDYIIICKDKIVINEIRVCRIALKWEYPIEIMGPNFKIIQIKFMIVALYIISYEIIREISYNII